jgi:hypothetical protein
LFCLEVKEKPKRENDLNHSDIQKSTTTTTKIESHGA